jgi:protocatechuate 3,4-dioxygenase beta subunit
MLLLCAAVAAQRGAAAGGVLPTQIWTPPPETPIPEGVGRINGRVLDRESDAPIRNATVTVAYLGPTAQQGGLRRPVASRVLTTDETGQFAASNLTTGDYSVFATMVGYTRARRLGWTIDSGQSVVLSTARLDGATTLKLARVASVSGVVTDAIGAPLAGACVRIYHHMFSGSQLLWQPMPVNAFTDAAGRYQFTSAPPGEYIVAVYYRSLSLPSSVFDILWSQGSAEAADRLRARFADSEVFFLRTPLLPVSGATTQTEGYRWAVRDAAEQVLKPGNPSTSGNATTYYPGARSMAEAQILNLNDGDRLNDVNIRVRRTEGVRIAGTLAGTPDQVAHVGLRLMPLDHQDVMQTFPGEVAATVTDAGGRFSFFAVPPGSVYLDTLVTAGGAAVPNLARGPRTPVYGIRQVIDVGRTDISDLTVPVREWRHIRGRFVYEPNASIPASVPPPVNISLASVGTSRVMTALRTVTSPPAFSFDEVPPGRFIIAVPNTGNWTVKSVTLGGRDVLNRAIDVVDADVANVIITMTTGINRLTGFVRDKDGLGLEGVMVSTFPANYRGWHDGGRFSGGVRSSLTGPRGAYSVSGLPDGDYLIVAFTNEVERDWQSLTALNAIAPLAQPVRFEGGRANTLDVRAVLREIPAKK